MEAKVSLPQLINGAVQHLWELGYAQATISTHEKIWRMLSAYALKKSTAEYTSELAQEFIREKYGDIADFPKTSTQYEYSRCLNKLDDYFRFGIISSKRPASQKTYVFPEGFESEIFTYLKNRKDTGLSESRIQSIKLYLERFTRHMQDLGVNDIHDLVLPHINSYIEYVTQFTPSTIVSSVSCLRGFLQYLYKNEILTADYSTYLPQLRHTTEDPIPSAFSSEDVDKILKCIDRNNAKGKRDFAMLMLASKMGLRSSEICCLQMGNLLWAENRLELIQMKTGNQLILPLLNEVGNAIIDYLKVRPQSDLKFVFLRVSPPYTRLESGSLYEITSSYMTRAGVHIPPGKKHGPHSLRHSLSSALLEKRVPLPVISGILAHKSTDTTKVYLRIDITQLRGCPLEVPPVNLLEGVQ